ncbi:MAG: dienelactone hydrolase family protein [Alphaproteobacteria bacterium]|nr:dienelactone hydrolase family protein [Alphaproteobacteria bacterium SS10]
MTMITINTADGSFGAYMAQPEGNDASSPAPGLLVIQEIFGVNKVMRDICDEYAAKGYVAVCPDIFWRQEPGIQLTDKTEEHWKRAFELYQGFDEAAGVEDLKATLAHMRGLDVTNGKVGSMGFCLGGKLAYLMATRSDADCNVSYYGVGIDNALDEAASISNPLLMHIAEKDGFVPPEAQAKIMTTVGPVTQVEAHTYMGQDHAFARVGGEHYDKASADVANDRTAEFLKGNLA